MKDYSGKRPLHLGCGEGLCSYLGASNPKLGDMQPRTPASGEARSRQDKAASEPISAGHQRVLEKASS